MLTTSCVRRGAGKRGREGREASPCSSNESESALAKGTLLRYSATEQQARARAHTAGTLLLLLMMMVMMMSQAAEFGEAFCFVLVKTVVSSSRWMSLWVITRCEGGGIFKKKKKDETNTESAASSSSNQSSVMGNAGLGVCAQNVSHLLPLVETLAIYGAFLLFLFGVFFGCCCFTQWHLRATVFRIEVNKGDVSLQRSVVKRGDSPRCHLSLLLLGVISNGCRSCRCFIFSFSPPSIFSLLFCFITSTTSHAPWNEAIAFSFSNVLQLDILSFQVRSLNI